VRRPGGPDRVIGGERADARFMPASTFKIPNTLIGLETGVIPDASFTLPWDGTERAIASWNQDHDLRGAIQESVVWWYQEIARRVGHARMRELVTAMRFGNGDIGGEDAIDRFWLEGPLAISPREQIDFLARLTGGELPVSARSVAILREVISSEARGEAVVRWKTGTHQLEDGSGHAWLVGWVEQGGEATAHFALILLASTDDELASHMSARRPLVMELLEREGLVPPG
jgi:beta-lactamase class D